MVSLAFLAYFAKVLQYNGIEFLVLHEKWMVPKVTSVCSGCCLPRNVSKHVGKLVPSQVKTTAMARSCRERGNFYLISLYCL